MVPPQSGSGAFGAERETGEIPARSRHCNWEAGLLKNDASFFGGRQPGSQIPAAEEEQTLSAERAHSALMSRGADSVRPSGPAGE